MERRIRPVYFFTPGFRNFQINDKINVFRNNQIVKGVIKGVIVLIECRSLPTWK